MASAGRVRAGILASPGGAHRGRLKPTLRVSTKPSAVHFARGDGTIQTLQQNESAVRWCVDLFNKRTLEWVDTCFAENAEWIELPIPSISRGRQGNRAFLRETAERILELYPDRQMSIRNLIAQGEQVVLELEWWGTAAAAVGGVSVGAQIHFRVASFFTLVDGLIVRQTDYCVPIPNVAASH
jgi:ketosteroid isomerase-like protein